LKELQDPSTSHASTEAIASQLSPDFPDIAPRADESASNQLFGLSSYLLYVWGEESALAIMPSGRWKTFLADSYVHIENCFPLGTRRLYSFMIHFMLKSICHYS
jgi:hypothetical protein